jgi:hypothetical protein
MSDIVERLRDDERPEWGICNEAADEIERLRAEVAGLRELLEVAQQGLLWYQDTYPNVVNDCDHEVMAQIAAALAARKGEA